MHTPSQAFDLLFCIMFKSPNTSCTQSPAKDARAMVVGVGAFLSRFCGLELVPVKWRCLVPDEHRDGAQSHSPAGTLSRMHDEK